MDANDFRDPKATIDSLPGGMSAAPTFSPSFLTHYAFVRTLGEGSMGTVHLFRQLKLDRLVAVKVVKGEEITGDQIRRLLKEARILAGLNHPNILAVHDVEGEGASPYLVSEYVEGQTLAQRLRQGSPPSLEEILALALPILDALAVAHEKEVVHRDLKPDNIFLTRDGRPKIGDFGLAKARFLPSGVSVGQIAGTPAYMSPEQCLGESTTPSSDLYSLGAILFEMATGRTPFTGPRLVDFLTQHVNQPAPRVRALRPDLPEAFDLVVNRALEKGISRRFASASDFQHALAEVHAAIGLTRSFGSLGSMGTRAYASSLPPLPARGYETGVPATGVPSVPGMPGPPSVPPVALASIAPDAGATRFMPVAGLVMGALALGISLGDRGGAAS